jgi:hypothetical protein
MTNSSLPFRLRGEEPEIPNPGKFGEGSLLAASRSVWPRVVSYL